VAATLNIVLGADERLAVQSTSSDTYAFTLAGGTWSGTDDVNVTGHGSSLLTVTSAGRAAFDAIEITDSAVTEGVEFTASGSHAYSNNFSIVLTRGSPVVTFHGESRFGTSNLMVSTSGSIILSSESAAARLAVSDGNIQLRANGAGLGSGNFTGIALTAGSSITSTGTGHISLTGRGSGNAGDMMGITLAAGSVIQSTSSEPNAGAITLDGTGGSGTANDGVRVSGENAAVKSAAGMIQIAGTAPQSGFGINLQSTNAVQATGTANVLLIADGMNLTGTSPIVAASFNRVTVLPRTDGTAIHLGGNDASGILGLTDAELDGVTAGTLQIGDVTSGAITVSAAITHPNRLSLTTGAGITVRETVTMDPGKSLTITADHVDIQRVIAAHGGITLQPATPARTIGLNDSTVDFNLSAAELDRLSSSGTVTIGAADGTGAIAIGGLGQIGALNYALTLRGGEVTFSNTLRVSSARTLTLRTGTINSAAGDGLDITAGTLDLDTRGAVGAAHNPLVTTIGNLHGTVAGNLFLRESTSLTISAPLSAGSNAIELNGGMFNLGDSERIDSNSRLNVNGGTLAMSSYSLTVAGVTLTSGTIGGTGVLTSATDFEVKSGTISPKLAGSVGLNKTTPGTVTLNNSVNMFTGATKIFEGTLAISADAGLGAPPASATPGHLVIDGGTLGTQGFILHANRGIRIGNSSGEGVGTIDVASGTLTYGGIITDFGTGGHQLVKTGAGTLRLGGVNTYRGGTVVHAGLISIAADSGLGIGPATETPGHLTLSGGGLRATESFELAANRGITLGRPSGSETGTIAVLQGKTLTYSGLITNHAGGAGVLAKKDGGTLVLGGANDFTGGTTYAGRTSILESNAGVIQLNHPRALGGSGMVFFRDSGGLRYGPGVTVDMSSRIHTGTSTETVRIDTNGNEIVFANALIGGGRLEKLGGGKLSLAAVGTTAAPTLYVRGGELAVTAGTLELTDAVKDPAFDDRASVFVRNAVLRIAGGTIRTAGSLVVGYASESATLAVSGGSLEIGTNPDAPARDLFAGAGIAATVDISGGITEIHGEFTVGSNSSTTVNVRGGTLIASRLRHLKQNHTTVNLTGGNVTVDEVVLETNTMADSSLTVNLDAGGTLTTDRMYLHRTGGTSGTHALTLRFDGGTLQKKSGSDVNLIDNILGTGGTLVWNVIIKDGGAKIETNGFDASVVRPLLHDSALGGTPDGGLIKKGFGRLTLCGTSTYTGETTIEAGILALAGASSNNIGNSSAIDVRPGATLDVAGLAGSVWGTLILAGSQTLKGKGIVVGNVTVAPGATLAPGDGPGILTHVGNLTLAGETKIEIAGAGPAGTTDGYSQLQVTGNGTVSIQNGAVLTLVETYTAFDPSAFQTFTLIDNDGGASDPVIGTFSDRADGSTLIVNGKTLKLFYNREDGNNVILIEAGTPPPLDDSIAGFALSKTAAVVSESGTTETFTVVLTAQPETHVTLTVSGSDSSEATVSPAMLVFSPTAWDSPQTVLVTGVDDSERDGDRMSLVTIAVDAGQSDARFSGVAAQMVSVTTLDNDPGWQNVDNPFDVDGDGFVTAYDVLILIDYINSNPGNSTLPLLPVSPPPYYDVNDDRLCTALDILLVINWLNSRTAAASSSGGAGEGEGTSPGAFPVANALLSESRSVAVQPVSAPAELLSAPVVGTRLVPPPGLLPATRLQVSGQSAEPRQIVRYREGEWPQAVDAALECWEPECDEVAGLPSRSGNR